jgi:hypothetical protein
MDVLVNKSYTLYYNKKENNKKEKIKLEWRDYLALFIASLETIAIPFILLIIALLIIYFVIVFLL